MSKLLPIQKFETLSIDVANKTFLINGKEFGKKCKRISIECVPPKWKIKVTIEQPMEFFFNLNGEILD